MELSGMRLEYDYNILPRNSVLIFSLFFIMSLFFFFSMYLPTEIYGSTGSTDSCELFANLTNCLETSSASNSAATSDLEQKSAETPLILPDMSPTSDDLNDIERDENLKIKDTDDNDGSATDSAGNDGDVDEENKRESDTGDESGNDPSLLPFP
jgi:hypothetical protein